MEGLEYNTELAQIRISEYGRIMQGFVEIINKESDRNKRTSMAKALIISITQLNPSLREQANYHQILWDHLHIISDYTLDVDAPYPPPTPEEINEKPERLSYPDSKIAFRYYGRNLQTMVNNASSLGNDENKKKYIDMIASFMKNSSRNWNNEDITHEQIVDHMKVLSGGALVLNAEEINTNIELRQRINNGQYKQKNKKKFFKPKKKR